MSYRMNSLYVLRNKINNKHYVGQTKKTIEERLYEHVCKSHADKPKQAISRAIKKYGTENFLLVERVHCDSKIGNKVEAELIVKYGSLVHDGYNVLPSGTLGELSVGWWLGKKMSQETVLKMSKNRKGKGGRPGSDNSQYGKKWSNERKESHSEKVKVSWEGLAQDQKERRLLGLKENYALGHKVSEETKKKIGDANRGKKHINRKTPKPITETTRDNMKAAAKSRVSEDRKMRILSIKEMIKNNVKTRDIANKHNVTMSFVRQIARGKAGFSVES